MTLTTLSRKRLAVLATGAVALVAVGLAGSAHAGTEATPSTKSGIAAGSTSGPEIHFWTLGEAKPGATIDVFAECGVNKNGVAVSVAEVSGAARATLTPQADGPYLVGEVTLPGDFAASMPLNLTCDNAATATTILVAGQAESTADGAAFDGSKLESAGMGEDDPATLPFEDGEGYLVPDDCDGGACTGPVATVANSGA